MTVIELYLLAVVHVTLLVAVKALYTPKWTLKKIVSSLNELQLKSGIK